MSGTDEYEVACIVGKAVLSGEMHYRVRWRGYSLHEDTWEPLSHLKHVRDLVNEFERSVHYPAAGTCSILCKVEETQQSTSTFVARKRSRNAESPEAGRSLRRLRKRY